MESETEDKVNLVFVMDEQAVVYNCNASYHEVAVRLSVPVVNNFLKIIPSSLPRFSIRKFIDELCTFLFTNPYCFRCIRA